ncbi:two-component system, OmpR family, sensor kinase [Thermoflexales bacterium]|nr:two-component system, OmpR family, sensor kinase [Thermoflexales bacterium]
MSIRLRLTLWYSAVLAVMLIMVGGSIYALLVRNVHSSIDAQLSSTADQILSASRVRTFSNILQVDIPQELDLFRAPGVGVVVLDNAYNVVQKSQNIGPFSRAFDLEALSLVEGNQTLVRDVVIDQASVRVLTVPIAVTTDQGDQRVGFLQIAAPLSEMQQSLRQLGTLMVLGGAIGVLAAAFVGAFLARKALEPIDRMTQTASEIALGGDLQRRITTPGPPDEVGRLTETFNVMLDRLEGMFKAQQRFSADISHELRTPLTTIRGNIDLLQRMGGADPASIEAMRSETDRMIRLVGDLLLLAQADAGLPIRREPIAIDQLASEVVHQVQVISGGVKVSLQADLSEPLCLDGDPDRLRQLLLNLLDNALKYTPGGGEVKLRVARENGSARLDVSDNGPGIPAQHLELGPNGVPLIFERFYRVEKSRTRSVSSGANGRSGSGTGLGLSIAYWIVQAHAGRIEIHSEIDGGTTMTVWLPLESKANL